MTNFPDNPTIGQVFTSGVQSWTWDGVKWVPSGSVVMPPLSTGENRIINGDMRIDQRNNGAAGTAGGYTVDRWQFVATQTSKITWQRISSTAPGFPYALQSNTSTAYTPLASDTFWFQQSIEADAISDFAWGATGAQPVTLSFWAVSSLTGTFSGTVTNFGGGNPTRSYPFTFSLPTALTWTRIVVAIPGDTSGTWVLSGNAGSLFVRFDLGSGSTYRAPAGAWANGNFIGANGAVNVVATQGALFQVTGVKLEIGSVATPFNRQSLAKIMADCQRYYQAIQVSARFWATAANQSTDVSITYAMRATPTAVLSSGVSGNVSASGPAFSPSTLNSGRFEIGSNAAGDCYSLNTPCTLSAEL